MASNRGLLDRALKAVGLKRSMPVGGIGSVYAGTKLGAAAAAWVFGPLSADASIRNDIRGLREIGRKLVRDNPYAARFVRAAAQNIIGADGVTLEVRLTKPTGPKAGDLHVDVNNAIEAAWVDWCLADTCSLDGRRSFVEVLQLLVSEWYAGGEGLLQLMVVTPTDENPYGFALNPLDADLLDETFNVGRGPTQNEVRMGVELDDALRPVAYHLWSIHPNDIAIGRARYRRRVPANEIIHLGDFARPGQTRSVTRFAPVMQALRDLGGFIEASVVGARFAACKMAAIEIDPEYEGTAYEPKEGEALPSVDAAPGSMFQLMKGQKVNVIDWNAPHPEFGNFNTAALRTIAAGLDVSYMTLTGDLSETNFSSGRLGQEPERNHFRRSQRTVIDAVVRRIFRRWVEISALAGAIPVRAENAHQVARAAVWMPKPFEYVDPVKDLATDLAEVDAGLNSLTRLAQKKGRDYAAIIAERSAEIQLAATAGVPLVLASGKANAATAEPKEPGDGSGDGSSNGTTPPNESGTTPKKKEAA